MSFGVSTWIGAHWSMSTNANSVIVTHSHGMPATYRMPAQISRTVPSAGARSAVRDPRQEADAEVTGSVDGGERADDGEPRRVGDEHQRAPVIPVGERSADEKG